MLALVGFVLLPAGRAEAALTQQQDTTAVPDSVQYRFSPIVVTATRSPREIFATPAPVSVIGRARIGEVRPNTITDLFRDVPGMDVTGVGAQQPRPMIRGQRGQRILLLEDGLRLNNARRQQDFGEIPALVDVSTVQRVEVVRGPASVLYGTDAIGGVINIITRRPSTEGLHGNATYRFGSAEEQHKGSGSVFGRFGALDFSVAGAVRRAGSYDAPTGTFGAVTLRDPVEVHGTGVEDNTIDARIGYAVAPGHRVFAGVERYRSRDAGFGFVAPADYAPEQPLIDIRYPDQRFDRFTAGYRGSGLNTVLADAVDFTAYRQDNDRTFTFNLFQSFGPQAPPGAGVRVNQFNRSDLRTYGFRLEARKAAAPRLLLTYGADLFRDRAVGNDSSLTTVVGFGPPQSQASTRPQVPNATFTSFGAFLQGEYSVGPATLVLGGRVQEYRARTRETPGLDEAPVERTDRTVVGAANLIYALSDHVSLIGSVGRAFRSPNLIEYFFEGPTPEGSGYQLRNPELVAETSLDVDLGVRYRDRRVALEGFVFRNRIRDGIRIAPLDSVIDGLAVYRNVNVDELVYRGIELDGEVQLPAGFALDAGYTRLESKDALDPENPVGETYSSRITAGLRFRTPDGRFNAGYEVRHNGERKDVALVQNPIGDALPAFTVHTARAGVLLFHSGGFTHRLNLTVDNLTDVLYAESSNASFFRPEPRRSFMLAWDVSF